MTLLILDTAGLTATIDGPALRIEQPDGRTRHVTLERISQVVVYGNAVVSCDVWRSLAEYGIPAVLFPNRARGKGEPAFMGAGLSAGVGLRMAQYGAHESPSARAVAARWLLRRKLGGYLKLIGEMISKTEDGTFETDTPKSETGKAAEKACSVIRKSLDALEGSTKRDVLMGHEGVAAGAWFEFLSRLLPEKWRFSGRNRRPPLDPVNALLSLGYTIALGDALRAIHQQGLTPGFGMLHELRPGRPSFALDILEPLRPCVDALTIDMLGKDLVPRDFTYGNETGCRLNSDAKKTYYTRWRQGRESWPWPLLADSEQEIKQGMPEIIAFSKSEFGPDNLDYCCSWILNRVVECWNETPGKLSNTLNSLTLG